MSSMRCFTSSVIITKEHRPIYVASAFLFSLYYMYTNLLAYLAFHLRACVRVCVCVLLNRWMNR